MVSYIYYLLIILSRHEDIFYPILVVFNLFIYSPEATSTTESPARKASSSFSSSTGRHNSSSMFSEKDRLLHDGDNMKTNQSFYNRE